MLFDPLYLLLSLPVFLFSFIAQWLVKSNFDKYSRKKNISGLTGKQVAEVLLSRNGIGNVRVVETSGWLSDHYSPSEKVLRLSQPVYASSSVAAIGVAAHEAGHAIQHHKGYSIMQLWLGLAKPAAFASNISIWLILSGAFLGIMGLAKVGFILFAVAVVFQIITLPVEFDASNRAKRLLAEYGIISQTDRAGINRVLNSAAMTYVAAAAASVSQLLYYAIRLGLIGRREE